jgi:hypothetical protein
MRMQKSRIKTLFVVMMLLFSGSVAQASQPDFVVQLKPAVDAFMHNNFETGKSLAQSVINEIVAQDPKYHFQENIPQLIRYYVLEEQPLDSEIIRECAYWVADPTTDANAVDAMGFTVLASAIIGILKGHQKRSYLEIMALLFTREDLDCNLEVHAPFGVLNSTLIVAALALFQYRTCLFLLSHPRIDLTKGYSPDETLLQNINRRIRMARSLFSSMIEDERIEGEDRVAVLTLVKARMSQKMAQ